MRLGRSRLSLALVCAWAATARAANYEVPTDGIETESDITAMEERGDISSATADTLLELFREGVDLNGADRDELYELPGLTYDDADAILLYRKARGHIDDPAELVAAGVLGEEKLLNIAPFVTIEPVRRLPVSGSARLVTATSNGDFLDPSGYQGPPTLFMGRLKLPWDLTAGVYLETTRRLPGTPRYDDLRDALVVDPFAYRLNLINSFLQWKGTNARVVLGTYDIGFGERLTFDSTRRFEPEGITLTEFFRRPIYASRECRISGDSTLSPCQVGDKDVYLTPDFTMRQPLCGLAASVEDLELGKARLSLHGWLSYQSRNIYQYEIYDRRSCDDPRDDSAAGCAAPPITVVHGNDLTQDNRLIFTTLPALYEELLAGARAEVKALERWRFAVTGYGANNYWHGAPFKLDTQEWSHVPFGGPFGAIGADVRGLLGDFTVFLEATRSFDSIPKPPAGLNPLTPTGGGGFGVEQRTVYDKRGNELEVSLRYYDVNFVNPYARPPSAPDEFDGQRARNEAGVRVRYMGKLPQDLELRARADFWALPYGSPVEGPAGTSNLYALARLTWERLERFRPSVWVDIRNRNLASNQHGGCASEYVPTSTGDNTFNCSGDMYRIAARVDFVANERWLSGAVQSFFTWRDDYRYKDRFRQDFMAWVELRSRLTDWLHVRVRSKYLHQDLSTDDYLERSLWSWLELVLLPNRQVEAVLRYDLYWYLDKRDTTLTRVPNPEHRFFLDFTYRF